MELAGEDGADRPVRSIKWGEKGERREREVFGGCVRAKGLGCAAPCTPHHTATHASTWKLRVQRAPGARRAQFLPLAAAPFLKTHTHLRKAKELVDVMAAAKG